MKSILFVALFLTAISINAQEEPFNHETWKPPYQLPIPDGWSIERFPIPIEFAPSIVYHGVEDIRFTPGWGDPKSEQYWSYSFLWFLDGKEKFKAKTFESNLEAYYNGLVGRNIESRKIPSEKVFPVSAKVRKIKSQAGDTSTYQGTIHMLDYMEQKPIDMNCLIHVKSCGTDEKTYVFYEISPQNSSHEVWTSMNEIWKEFRCSIQ